MRYIYITLIFSLFTLITNSQISRGGYPVDVPVLKGAGIPRITMPHVDNNLLRQQAKYSESGLKPMKFAHSFDVSISPAEDGIWIHNFQGFNIWKLKIYSEGALSINLIFDDFKLPDGARLFIYNKKENYFLGAYTSANNKSSGKFAVSPVAGDEISIQYEVPADYNGKNDFIIKTVNHDFIGILKLDYRRPSGKLPGECNIDINCDIASRWQETKNAVCRYITSNVICTGTLVNNTAENKKPYIITAAHCFTKPKDAEISVFTFNYESPYCGVLDGDPSNSISGGTMRAYSDTMDFALLELSLVPPPEFRPYYAGWDNRGQIPDSTVSIHHPEGHIKKISFDYDKPVFSDYIPDEYTPNGFYRIKRWDMGVTEEGSSGGALFNPSQKIIGTLTGGLATCGDPVNDFFSRFDMAWEYKSDSSQQLKPWLDPLNSGAKTLQGLIPYNAENLCKAFTNLTDEDQHELISLYVSGQFEGYWGGTNNEGINTFAERFSIPGNEQLDGISIGVGRIYLDSYNSSSEININVFNGDTLPNTLIHSQTVKIRDLVADAMNYIQFDSPVEPSDTFYVGFELGNMAQRDTFVVLQSLRLPERKNDFFFRQNGSWYNFKYANTDNYSICNVFELVACNVEVTATDTPKVKNPGEALIYPNPTASAFTLETGQDFDPGDITIVNLIGQETEATFSEYSGKKIQIDLAGNIPGIYFVRVKTNKGPIVKKVSYIPW